MLLILSFLPSLCDLLVFLYVCPFLLFSLSLILFPPLTPPTGTWHRKEDQENKALNKKKIQRQHRGHALGVAHDCRTLFIQKTDKLDSAGSLVTFEQPSSLPGPWGGLHLSEGRVRGDTCLSDNYFLGCLCVPGTLSYCYECVCLYSHWFSLMETFATRNGDQR